LNDEARIRERVANRRRAGQPSTVLRKQGRWHIARAANLLAPVQRGA
jgi:hypothetical protein